MNAQSVIKKYNAFNGKVVDYTMLDEFFHQVKDVVCVVDKSSMHYEHVKLIEKRVGKTLKVIGKGKVKIQVEPIIAKRKKKKKTVIKPLAGVKKELDNKVDVVEFKPVEKSKSKEPYAVDAAVLAGVDFKEYKLTGRWKNEIGDKLYSDNQLMFWGMPGHGKTVLQLQLAQYIAEELKLPVLYIANEEFKRSTLAQKIKQFKIGHPNLKFAKSINEKEIGKYAVVFFDSINSLGMSLKEYLKFRERHADKLFVLVVQSTKDGNFRGGQDWEHEVDIAGEVINRKLIIRKHRLDPDNAKKAEKMATQQAIKEARKKKEIRQAIFSQVNDKKLKPVQP